MFFDILNMMDANLELDIANGTPKSGLDINKRFIAMSRKNGITYRLVRAIQNNKKVAIIIHNLEYADYIKRLIESYNQEIDINNITFLVFEDYMTRIYEPLYKNPNDYDDIFVDNKVWEKLLEIQSKSLLGMIKK